MKLKQGAVKCAMCVIQNRYSKNAVYLMIGSVLVYYVIFMPHCAYDSIMSYLAELRSNKT